MILDNKKIDSLERLLKGLSDLKNDKWAFKDYLQFINDARSCAELVNDLRDMKKFSDKAKAEPLPIIEEINKEEKKKKGK